MKLNIKTKEVFFTLGIITEFFYRILCIVFILYLGGLMLIQYAGKENIDKIHWITQFIGIGTLYYFGVKPILKKMNVKYKLIT